MPTLNKVILIGHLGKDPESKFTTTGKQVATFSIATTWGSGDKKQTDWHNIVCWEKTAEIACEYLKKGNLACVEGRISNRTYDKDGVKHYVTEIIASQVMGMEKRTSEKAPDGEGDLPF
jgi:single-strand DNA-binding protein